MVFMYEGYVPDTDDSYTRHKYDAAPDSVITVSHIADHIAFDQARRLNHLKSSFDGDAIIFAPNKVEHRPTAVQFLNSHYHFKKTPDNYTMTHNGTKIAAKGVLYSQTPLPNLTGGVEFDFDYRGQIRFKETEEQVQKRAADFRHTFGYDYKP